MTIFEPLSATFSVASVNNSGASSLVAGALTNMRLCGRRVMATWTRNDGGAALVARQPVLLGELLRGEWTPQGWTLTEFAEVK